MRSLEQSRSSLSFRSAVLLAILSGCEAKISLRSPISIEPAPTTQLEPTPTTEAVCADAVRYAPEYSSCSRLMLQKCNNECRLPSTNASLEREMIAEGRNAEDAHRAQVRSFCALLHLAQRNGNLNTINCN